MYKMQSGDRERAFKTFCPTSNSPNFLFAQPSGRNGGWANRPDTERATDVTGTVSIHSTNDHNYVASFSNPEISGGFQGNRFDLIKKRLEAAVKEQSDKRNTFLDRKSK